MAYVPATFSCPHCRAPLRLRHRPAGTLHLPCPDCGRPLELSDQSGELLVRPAEETAAPQTTAPPAPARSAAAVGAGAGSLARLKSALDGPLQNPLAVTWLAAGAAAVILTVAFLRSGPERKPAAVTAAPTARNAGEKTPPEQPAPAPQAELRSKEIAFDPPPPETVPAPAVVERPLPVAAPKPPASPPVDPREAIAARLAQRVLRFEQPTPVPFDMLRLQIEDLAGVPIRYDDAIASDPAVRNVEVRLSLADVALAEVLDEAARQAGLAHVIDADAVRLIPAGDRVSANGPATNGVP